MKLTVLTVTNPSGPGRAASRVADCCVPDEQRLMAHLLVHYEPASRPVYNASNKVTVSFGLTLTQISDMVRD